MKRKIMKTLAIGVAIVMMVSSLGCGKPSADSNASLPLQVLPRWKSCVKQ